MTTLTITEARKNLGRWLTAAARGEDIAIISGADVIALRKVAVQAVDCAQTEYQASPDQISRVAEAVDRRYRALSKKDPVKTPTTEDRRKLEVQLQQYSPTELQKIRDWLEEFLEDQLEFTPEFEAQIQQSERELAQGLRPRVRRPDGAQ